MGITRKRLTNLKRNWKQYIDTDYEKKLFRTKYIYGWYTASHSLLRNCVNSRWRVEKPPFYSAIQSISATEASSVIMLNFNGMLKLYQFRYIKRLSSSRIDEHLIDFFFFFYFFELTQIFNGRTKTCYSEESRCPFANRCCEQMLFFPIIYCVCDRRNKAEMKIVRSDSLWTLKSQP